MKKSHTKAGWPWYGIDFNSVIFLYFVQSCLDLSCFISLGRFFTFLLVGIIEFLALLAVLIIYILLGVFILLSD